MKNENLMRAIGRIDDDLINEARLPMPVKRSFTALKKYVAVAACFLVLLTAVLITRRSGNLSVVVGGASVLSGQRESAVEIPMTTSVQLRSIAAAEVTIALTTDGEDVTIISEPGGILLDSEGAEYRELTTKKDISFHWLLQDMQRDNFTITLHRGGETVQLIATVNADSNTLTVSAKHLGNP